MRVVSTVSPRPVRHRPPAADPDRDVRVERLALGATSLVVALGLTLAYAGVTRDIAICEPAARPCVLNLSDVQHATDLVPWLTIFPDTHERTVVARAIVAQLGSSGPIAIEHVGALAGVTLPAAQVRSDAGLVVLNERLESRPETGSIPVLTGSDVAALGPSLVVRTPEEYRTRLLLAATLFMVSFWLAHLVRARRQTIGDPLLLPTVHLLTGLGVMTMVGMRDPLRDTIVAGTVVGGIAAGCALWTALSVVDFENPTWRRSMLLPLGAALLLAAALLLFGGGPAGSGAKVNLWGVQPVEAIRLLVAFSLAAYFARRWTFLRQFSDTVTAGTIAGRLLRLPRWVDVRPLAATIALLLAFFFLQKDLGPALVFSCVFLALYGVARGRVALVLCGMGVLAAGFAGGYALGVPSTVTRRVAIWLDPWNNALVGGDQLAHAFWALASGGFWGIGSGIGDPHVIPAGHTDLVLAAIGEELGVVGVACVLLLLVLLVSRLLTIALRAPGDYSFFLTLGLTLLLAVQAIVIIGGTLGVLPLAGVVAPFLSYGRSSMLSNLVLVGVCAAVARRRGPRRMPFVAPVRALRWTLATAGVALLTQAALVQVVHADAVATRANLTEQGDGGLRFQYNPRLLAAGRRLVRGTIFDRNGIPLATSRPEDMTAAAEASSGLDVTGSCLDAGSRCYPLGGLAFHLLGDADRQINWAAPNTSFIEREMDAHLKGFDDRARVVQVPHPRDGRTIAALRRDFSELLPLVRHKGNPAHPDVRAIVERNRDVRLSIDAGLQIMVARALAARTLQAGATHGAAVVLDPRSGELLASASYPWPTHAEISGSTDPAAAHLLDRARYGLYPPGSTFKLITAVAAFRSDASERRHAFECVRLPDGRVGGRVPGSSRPVRDDAQNRTPHGTLDLHRALVVSCNAYFANLARRLGSTALAEAAAAAQITVAASPVASNLERTLPHAGYGQGEVLATPLRMARATGALAVDGRLRDVRVTRAGAIDQSEPLVWVHEAAAAQLRRDMREVVRTGTGRALAGHAVPIAGKTGTAEVDGARPHAWFVGFAPYRDATAAARLAFAVVIEHGGSGGRVAAPLAGDVVSAARARGLLE